MFTNFRVFMQKEFGKHPKHNKTTAKLAGFGIANSVTDKDVEKIEQLKAQALMIAMELFKAALEKNSPTPTNPKKGAAGEQKKKCQHCGWKVYHKPEACFELDANAAKCLAGCMSKKSTQRCWRSSQQSSGNRERSISLN
jgi:hypothetical protein